MSDAACQPPRLERTEARACSTTLASCSRTWCIQDLPVQCGLGQSSHPPSGGLQQASCSSMNPP